MKDAFLKTKGILINTSLDALVRQISEQSSDLKVPEVNRELRNAIIKKGICYHKCLQPLEYIGLV